MEAAATAAGSESAQRRPSLGTVSSAGPRGNSRTHSGALPSSSSIAQQIAPAAETPPSPDAHRAVRRGPEMAGLPRGLLGG